MEETPAGRQNPDVAAPGLRAILSILYAHFKGKLSRTPDFSIFFHIPASPLVLAGGMSADHLLLRRGVGGKMDGSMTSYFPGLIGRKST